MGGLIDMTGERFGRLVVERRAATTGDKQKQAEWWCVCDCGNKTVVRGAALRSGNTRSCGCLRVEGGWARKSEDERLERKRRTWGIQMHPKNAWPRRKTVIK